MKIIFTLTVLAVLSLTAQPVFSTSFTNHGFTLKTGNGDDKNVISIVSNRVSCEMQLRFTCNKAGKAFITIQNGSGKIVLHQTNKVSSSINTISLKNATGLTEGSYTVRLISNNQTYIASFLIWK